MEFLRTHKLTLHAQVWYFDERFPWKIQEGATGRIYEQNPRFSYFEFAETDATAKETWVIEPLFVDLENE